MKLTFLGTRANTESANQRHRRHSALMVSYRKRRVMIDCGADWRGRISEVGPHAIFLTHAHPDHAWGLAEGVDCPVYATAETWAALADYPIGERVEVKPRRPVALPGGLTFEAFPVVHSLRAPAVGYRLSAGRRSLFYVPDVVDIQDRRAALAGADLFVGDGATLTRPLVRRRDGQLFGHTTVRAQLGWCRQAGIAKALFTHCGNEIIQGDERVLGAKVRAMGRDRGVEATLAHDGMTIVLR